MAKKTRRELLVHTSMLAATSVLMPKPLLAATLGDDKHSDKASHPRTIIGYCWPQTVRPQQSLDVMVSTHTNEPYQAN